MMVPCNQLMHNDSIKYSLLKAKPAFIKLHYNVVKSKTCF